MMARRSRCSCRRRRQAARPPVPLRLTRVHRTFIVPSFSGRILASVKRASLCWCVFVVLAYGVRLETRPPAPLPVCSSPRPPSVRRRRPGARPSTRTTAARRATAPTARAGFANPNSETDGKVPGVIFVKEGYTRAELRKKIVEGLATVGKRMRTGRNLPYRMPGWAGTDDRCRGRRSRRVPHEPLSEVGGAEVALSAFAASDAEGATFMSSVSPLALRRRSAAPRAVSGRLPRARSSRSRRLPPRRRAQASAARAALEKDAVCRACHGESWVTPLLDGLSDAPRQQSRCRARPVARTATGTARRTPRIRARARMSCSAPSRSTCRTADARNASCLGCHESKVLPRANWTGSQHQTRGVACTDCHNIHAPDQKVLSKATQAEVCFTCHKAQRAQTRRISTHPLAVDRPGQPRQDGLLGLPQPARLDRADAAHQELGQRNLLHLPPGEARAVPLGTRSRRRQLHQLPHAARLGQRAAAQDARAVALPGVPQRRPRQPGQQRRESGRRRRDHDQRRSSSRARRRRARNWPRAPV